MKTISMNEARDIPFKTEPNATVGIVTPEVAEYWLSLNTGNRKDKLFEQRILMRALRENGWSLTTDGIGFGSGELYNGQNRLKSISKTGIAGEVTMVWGLEEASKPIIDTGIRRSLADILYMKGDPDYQIASQVAGYLHRWETDREEVPSGRAAYPSNAEGESLLERHTEIRNGSFSLGKRAKESLGYNSALAAYLHYIFGGLNKEDSNFFWDRFIDGQISADHPIAQLRRAHSNLREERHQPSPRYLQAITIKAWNHFRDGTTTQRLFFRPGGTRAEMFPTPH